MATMLSMAAFLSRPVADFLLEDGETESSQRILSFCQAANFVDICDLVRPHSKALPEEMLTVEDFQVLRQRLAVHDLRPCFGPGSKSQFPTQTLR